MNESRKTFHAELKELENEMLKMGSIVGESIRKSIESLVNKDFELADQVIADDDIIDDYEVELEEKCTRLIALQQPVAIDLRKIIVISKLATDLERIGDHASNIAYRVKEIGQDKLIKQMQNLPKMTDLVVVRLQNALRAFVNMDLELAQQVIERDEEVDLFDEQIQAELIRIMNEDCRNIPQGTSLMFISRYLERIGDHSTNICERTIYMKTGNRDI